MGLFRRAPRRASKPWLRREILALHRHRVFDAFLDERRLGRAMQLLVGGLSLAGRPLAFGHETGLGGPGEFFVRRLGHTGILREGERRRARFGHRWDLPNQAVVAA